jgi:nucleotide-binding universal stress UspA family protein
MKLQKVLFPTDGSPSADAAVETVQSYLELMPDIKVTVLYVTSKSLYAYDFVPDVVDEYEAKLSREIQTKVEATWFSNWSNRVEFIHLTGLPVQAICDYAQDNKVDLIIMGSHGRGAFDRMILGSVSQGVLHRSPVSVLVARGSATKAKSSS